jgi:hypothetical protein
LSLEKNLARIQFQENANSPWSPNALKVLRLMALGENLRNKVTSLPINPCSSVTTGPSLLVPRQWTYLKS